MIVTIARYRAITGDTASSDTAVSARIEEATDMLIDDLGRELEEAERTESLQPTRDGYLWPSCVPITACTGYTIDGHGVWGTFGPAWPNLTGLVELTYTGGWVERSANPNADNRLPAYIERDLCFAAYELGHAQPAGSVPAGATSVRLGDASVTFGPDGPPRPGTAPKWSRQTMRWRNVTQRASGVRP